MPDGELHEIASLEVLIERIELKAIETFQLYGIVEAGYGEVRDLPPAPEDPNVIDLNTTPAVKVLDDGLDVRLRLFLRTAGLVMQVDVGAAYRLGNPAAIPDEIAFEFSDRIALMNLWPFVRQQVADLSLRLSGVDTIVLPLMRPTEIGGTTQVSRLPTERDDEGVTADDEDPRDDYGHDPDDVPDR